MKKSLLAALALTAVVATPASAVVVLGNTTGGPTYNRVLVGNPPTALSGVGTAVRYQVTQFTVGTGGSYDFLMLGTTPPNWDTFLTLYAGSFNPAAPLTNALVANDDFPTIGRSGFSRALMTGTSYFAVAAGFGNGDFGAYSLEITGPGTITIGGGAPGAVPEPGMWALMIAGFGMIGSALRRRRRQTAFA